MSEIKLNILEVLSEAHTTLCGWRHYEIPRGWVPTKDLCGVEIGTHRFGGYIEKMRKEGFKIETKIIREALNIHTGQVERIRDDNDKPKKLFIYRLNTPDKFIDWETGKLDKAALDIEQAAEQKNGTRDLFEGF